MVLIPIAEGHTRRLVLRPLALDDAPQIQSLFPQWQVVKYLAAKVPWPYPPDGAEQFIRDVALPQMERGEGWHWTIRLRTAPGTIVGAIGLFMQDDENRGFWLSPAHRGEGYMTEACAWTNDFWFDTLRQPLLRVPKAVANTGSRHISERMGMRVIRLEMRDYVSGRLPSEIWEITTEEWHAWKLRHPIGAAPAGQGAGGPHSRAGKASPSRRRISPASKRV
jgi:RimJ/RimL family protein N-acetyltransferase